MTDVRGPARPAGWPASVLPPGTPGWERTAVAWLLDLCPPEYRSYELLRTEPVVLARLAARHVHARAAAARRGLATARTELRDVVPADVVHAAVEAWEREGARMLGTARGVGLLEEALRCDGPSSS